MLPLPCDGDVCGLASIVCIHPLCPNGNLDRVVYDKESKDPLIGASVLQKGTSNGVTTDLGRQVLVGRQRTSS